MSAMVEQSAAPKWVRTTLGAVTEEKVSQMGPQGRTEFVYVDISSIDNKTKRVVEPKTLPAGDAPSRAKQNLKGGDVLVSMTRPNLNAVALVPPALDGAVGSTGFHVLRAREAEPSWLFYSVQTNDFIDAMCRLVQGALYPAVRPKDIRAYPVPIPPLNEQRRIVAEIEKQFTRLEAGVAGLRRVQANLKRYRAAVLKAACEGKLTEEWRKEHPEVEPASELLKRILAERRQKWNGRGKYKEPAVPNAGNLPLLPEGWTWATVDQLSTKIVDGTHHTPEYVSDGIAFISVKDVRDGRVYFDDCKFISPGAHAELTKRCAPERGDMLITKSGTIGRMAIVNTDRPFSLFVSVALIKPIRGIYDARFLKLALEYYIASISIAQNVKGGLLKNLHLEDLRVVPLRVPPLAEQNRIVAEVERRLSVVEELDAVVSANLQRATRLRQSILQRAFEGELVRTEQGEAWTSSDVLPIAAEAPSTYYSRANKRGSRKG